MDGNNKFFHRMANARFKNQINKISMNGSCTEDPEEIEQAIIHYFTTLCSSPPNRCRRVEGLVWERISSDKAEFLERRFNEEEILGAILEMEGEKSSGLDGFTMTFYKK